MKTISYKGKKYPIRTFNVVCEGESRNYKISINSLYSAIENKIENWGTKENNIDCEIYYYLDDDLINSSAEDICKNHLDVEMIFISEI